MLPSLDLAIDLLCLFLVVQSAKLDVVQEVFHVDMRDLMLSEVDQGTSMRIHEISIWMLKLTLGTMNSVSINQYIPNRSCMASRFLVLNGVNHSQSLANLTSRSPGTTAPAPLGRVDGWSASMRCH